MKNFEVTIKQVSVANFWVEANTKDEAEKLFADKMRSDDCFVDDICFALENGIVDEEVTATESDYDGTPDFTYNYMTEKKEEEN